jgi:GTPase SAR1 family protein
MSAADMSANGYELIQHHRARLLESIASLCSAAASLKMQERVDALDVLARRIASDAFKVLVLGEFRRGKSMTINALLGQKVLPAFAVPTTATINEVKWGERPSAVLHPRPVNGERPEAREIAVEELEYHVTVGADDHQRNPYERVEVFWPLDLCEDGVVIVDSPGLNDHATREQITTDYLQDVDAIIFVFAADQLGTRTELSVIDNLLRPLGHDHLFLVVNRINLIDESERALVIDRGTRRIAEKTELGADGVFFVDARGALAARVADDEAGFEQAGFAALVKALERFLARDRGKLKILAPANEVRTTLKDILTHEIPEREAMLSQSLETLEQRVAEAQEPLRGLEAERDLILERLNASIHGIRVETVSAARAFYEDAGSRIPQWAGECEVQTVLNIVRGNREQMEALTIEVAGHLEQKLQEAFLEWQAQTLQPLLHDRLDKLAEALNAQAEGFIEQAEAVRVEIAGLTERLREGVDVEHRDASALERVVAAGGGFLIGGPGAAMIGASGGVQGLVRGLLPQLAVGVAGLLVLGPGAVLVALLMGVAALQALLNRDKLRDKAVTEIGKQAAHELRSLQDARAEDVGAAVEQRLGELRSQVAKGLEREITRVHEQIEVVLAAKREGQASVDAQRRQLSEARRELDRIAGDVSDVLADLVAL